MSHSVGGWESKIKALAGLAPLRAVRENLFHAFLPASGGVLTIFGSPWLLDTPL